MTNIKKLKKELKIAEKELNKKKNIELNKDLIETLKNEIALKENLREKGYKTKLLNKIANKFEKYNPKIKILNNVKYKGNKIVRFKFNSNVYEGGDFSRDKVKTISNKISNYLQKNGMNGLIMTSIKLGEDYWRSGYFTDLGDDVEIYDAYTDSIEQEKDEEIRKKIMSQNMSSFVVYAVLKQKAEGGNDKYNDCFYNCLKDLINDDLIKCWKTPEAFKKYLGLSRLDKVPLSSIPKVEERLKTYSINVRGNDIYISPTSSNKVINLLLSNQHYTIDKELLPQSLCQKSISYKEKIILLYDTSTFEAYNGTNKYILSKEDKKTILSHKTEYLLVDRFSEYKTLSIEDEYNKLIVIFDTLKKETNGIINMYKTGSIKNTALDIFNRFCKCVNTPEPILQDEALWIQEASKGAILVWAENYEGPMYKYDVKSMYPYIMTLMTNKFPVKRGEFKKIDKIEEFIQFGIYRCRIEKSKDENINKLFKFNKKGYYTSNSLNHAKKLSLKIELIQDEKPNFLYYSGDKTLKFGEVFGDYVDFMFSLKEKNIPLSKDILNRLWGALCEKVKIKLNDKKRLIIDDDEEINELKPLLGNEDIDYVYVNKINERYKTTFARLCPFLLSKGRSYACDLMIEHKEHIHRINVDGFITDKLIHTNKNVKLGELKYEGYLSNGLIKNCTNKIEFPK